MKGKSIPLAPNKRVIREMKGAQPHNEPDDSLACGGRAKRKKGGKIEGMAMKPNMGRAMRARGGKAGADLHPLTNDAGSGPKGRHVMSKSGMVP